MGVVNDAVRTVSRTAGRAAAATTAAAGAVGGAAVNGVVGAVTGAAAGVQKGISSGSHSMPAAALTLGALGVAGLIEWPLVLAIGGGALLLRQLNNGRADSSHKARRLTPMKAVPTKSTGSARHSHANRRPSGHRQGGRAAHSRAPAVNSCGLGTFGIVRASPLRAVALGIQVTSALVGATVQTAANAAGSLGTVASTGLTMAAIPVREGVKALSEGLPAPTLDPA